MSREMSRQNLTWDSAPGVGKNLELIQNEYSTTKNCLIESFAPQMN